jgi:hypothetical protein
MMRMSEEDGVSGKKSVAAQVLFVAFISLELSVFFHCKYRQREELLAPVCARARLVFQT